ncbi:aldehyde dehydrogenase family protein [Alteromonas lipolytica]|uniref:Aldehyde dehydrogenase n=1 Tax=Alteromonas lipolytica TaxID=1856405 RepID=A0A1E8FHR2_9ALTE|nr:aldehyde dehydrogenase family protein [Alteromonas lipolytica]OFI35475.1 aldehyde dehydrogenase [Alteromonas lipolytica]GGF76566.1 aldehyde dehydrogenase [Alteromonas lipolytica]
MKDYPQLYINGQWVNSASDDRIEVINPANGELYATVPAANHSDIDAAVAAAKAAFDSFSTTSADYRRGLIHAIADGMEARKDELIEAIVNTMGCPIALTDEIQVQGSIDAFRSFASLAGEMDHSETFDNYITVKEAVGVCVLINPWNYPLSQLAGKLGPALAAGCTTVLKPAEQTPLQDLILADIIHNAGVPAGVVNVLTAVGSDIGDYLCSHPQVDMVSFTGSTLAGIKVAQAAAPSVKRVCQELGGKSPYIIAPGADLAAAVRYGVEDVMINSGQTCCALTRMLVPAESLKEAEQIAASVAAEWQPGNPLAPETMLGPVSSHKQQQRINSFIRQGIDEGAKLVCGGQLTDPALANGAYVPPTIFSNVSNDMTIAKEEIFGPVLCILPYETLEQAIQIANDTPYGLSSGVYAKDAEEARQIARRIRAGQCYIQGALFNTDAPFGGYKQSGNGREWGVIGLHEYTETKALII